MFVNILINRFKLKGIESKSPLVYWLIDLDKETLNQSDHNHHANQIWLQSPTCN